MNWCSLSTSLLAGALLPALAATASAVPHPPKAGNQAALLQQRAKASAQHHLLQQRAKASAQQHLLQQAAASRQHHLLTNHTQTFHQQLLKTNENFFKLHLLEQARRPVPPPSFYGYEFGDPALDRAPMTRIRPPAEWTQPAHVIQPAR